MSLIPLAAASTLFHLGFAYASNGGLGDAAPDNGGKKSTKIDTTAITNSKGKTTGTETNTETGTTEKTENTETNTETSLVSGSYSDIMVASTSGSKVTYNQWGFTGSQSKWSEAQASDESKTSGSTSGSSAATSSKNKTSGAYKVSAKRGWKSSVFLGAVTAFTIGLHCL